MVNLKTNASYSKRVVCNWRSAQILTQPAYVCNARALVRDLGVNARVGVYHVNVRHFFANLNCLVLTL